MLDKLTIALQYALPKHGLSRLAGSLAQARLGPLTTAAIRAFIRAYDVDMSEAAEPDPRAYASFNDFFTRPLRAGVRPLVEQADALAHPVDGTISQAGLIRNDTLIQAKHHDYSATALLGGDEDLASQFEGGQFCTIYLAPRDYHRIHMPCDATLRQMIYVPGELFSVNPLTTEQVPGLFARNERVVCLFDTAFGPMAMVLVGATIVASIETVWAGPVTPPRGHQVFRWHYAAQGHTAIRLQKGEEMGRFKLGSTVILLFPANSVRFADNTHTGSLTRMGSLFGHQLPRS